MNYPRPFCCIPQWLLIALFLLSIVPLTQADPMNSEDTTTQVSIRKFAFRPAPLSVCRSHFITETSFKLRINSSPTDYLEIEENNSYYWTADVGYLVNISPVTGVGGTLFFGADHDGARFGIRARMRRWLKNDLTLDIAPGLFLNIFDNNVGSYPNLFISVALGHKSGVSGVIQMDRIAYDGDEIVLVSPPNNYGTIRKKQTAFYFGISIDGNRGPTSVFIGLLLVALGGAASAG